MRKALVLLVTISIIATTFMGVSTSVYADGTDIGIWYSTWYSKLPAINTDWILNFGGSSLNQFVGDVNGDGKDDAVTFNSSGVWNIAISNGNGFNAATQWISGHGTGSNKQFLADVNGDGKADAVAYTAGTGTWNAAISNGSGFNTPTQWVAGYGIGSNNQFLADANGDGKKDAIVYFSSLGAWYVALSNGNGFSSYSQWTSGHGVGSYNQLMGDVNGDGKEDAIVYFSSGDWYAANSSGNAFGSYYTLTTGHGLGSVNQYVCDGNGDGYADLYVYFNADVNGDGKTGDLYGREYDRTDRVLSGNIVLNSGFGYNATKIFQGNTTGDEYGWKATVAFNASTGSWKVERYRYADYISYNTWLGWKKTIEYVPYTLGSYQQYDSGNADVIGEHLATISQAQIDYLLLDETNGLNNVSGAILSRAKKLAQGIKTWNDNTVNRDVKYAFAIGRIQWTNNPQTIENEARQVWDEFANNAVYGGSNYHYYFNGKPLLVVYGSTAHKAAWESWGGDKTNAGHFTLRWAHSPSIAGTYGWEVRNGTVDNDEVMVVMPGWNNNAGVTPVSRSNGDYYSLSCWSKVLNKTTKPQIVVINSFNEYAEETAVAVTDTTGCTGPTEKWYNKSGVIDNSMYWDMTVNYIKSLKTPEVTYQASAGFSSTQGANQWYYQQWNGSIYTNMLWNTSRWKGTDAYCLTGSNWQHPDTQDSVRKWVAPRAGSIRITASGKIYVAANGDGVKVKVLKNSSNVWPMSGWQSIAANSSISFPQTDISVATGDALYFILNKNGTNGYDTTTWDPIITYLN